MPEAFNPCWRPDCFPFWQSIRESHLGRSGFKSGPANYDPARLGTLVPKGFSLLQRPRLSIYRRHSSSSTE